MIKFGLKVEFNGSYYVLQDFSKQNTYDIGEMVCELSRLNLVKVRDILVKLDAFHEPMTKEAVLEALAAFRDSLRQVFPPVISEMVYCEFYNSATEYIDSDDEWKEVWIQSVDDLASNSAARDAAFLNTGYDSIGVSTVGQFLLSVYLLAETDYIYFQHAFNTFLNSDEAKGSKRNYFLYRMTKRDWFLQQIDYRILYYGNRFNSLFTIKTMSSLCAFEMAHIYDKNVPIVKCKNCGHYFVPKNRSDTKYCNYPAPGNPEKTCKEVGAQNTWNAKEKTDDVTRAYRRVYMRYKMKVNRHPEDKEAQATLERLTKGIREWRQKISAGEAEKEAFISWLDEFSQRGGEAE